FVSHHWRRMFRVSLLLVLIGTIECRVKFTYSEFLDGSDLKTVSQTDFACPKGCMIFSATENEKLAIFNKANGNEVTNLKTLANYNNDKDKSFLYGWTLTAGTYTLMNKDGLSGAQFGLYVVSQGAPNYGQFLRVADAFSSAQFSTTTGWMTIMTRGTGIRMVTLNSAGNTAMTPKVFATGYDATGLEDECWPLYNASSVSHAQQSQIDVIGPIATIRFDGLPSLTAATVHVGGDVMTEASDTPNSLTISSPGFHGCYHVSSTTLYDYNLNTLNRRFRSDLDQGVNVHIRSKQWIAVDSDALIITGLQDQPIKLMGEESYEQNFLVNKVDIQLAWQRTNKNSNFAVQMDATKSAATSPLLVAFLSSIVLLL
ncbi:hypothetical protein PENTCL1PPCAC_27360, partial [Pristionchus entomophagus]